MSIGTCFAYPAQWNTANRVNKRHFHPMIRRDRKDRPAGGEFILMRFQQVNSFIYNIVHVQHGIIIGVDQLLLGTVLNFVSVTGWGKFLNCGG